MYKLNWTTEQHQRLHLDMISLIEVLYPPEERCRLADKLAKRLENAEARMRRRSQTSGNWDRNDKHMTIKDFDPVYCKKKFPAVRQSVLRALCVPSHQEKGSFRSQSQARKEKLK